MIKKEKSELKIMIETTIHKPVLLKEVIEGLDIKKEDFVLDATVGGGAYLENICQIVGKKALVIGLDQDSLALKRAEKRISAYKKCPLHLVQKNFRYLDEVLEDLKITRINKAVFDLGISSDQLEVSERGFSFLKEESLLMTLKDKQQDEDLTAKEIVNNWDEENIADIIFGYGEERFAKRIAQKICLARKEKEIKTTLELVEIIRSAVPKWYQFKKTHFATKTFQALRITVNDEIEALKEALNKTFEYLEKNGRIVVVSFHSLEDRVVKKFFKEKHKEERALLLTKKPITPSEEEILQNPRSRSAKLRIIEKIK